MILRSEERTGWKMARRAVRPCAYPGCIEVIDGGGMYCGAHRSAEENGRGSAAARGYGYRWQKLRLMQLRRQPICADPFAIHGTPVEATEVDHIVPRSRGGTDQFENLQSLCKACHSRKTVTIDGGFGREGVGGI